DHLPAACPAPRARGRSNAVSTPRPSWPVLTRRSLAGFEVSIEVQGNRRRSTTSFTSLGRPLVTGRSSDLSHGTGNTHTSQKAAVPEALRATPPPPPGKRGTLGRRAAPRST